MEKWNSCSGTVDPQLLRGRECYAGLDLVSSQDLSALVLAFPDDDEGVTVLPFFWAPQEDARKRERNDRAPYLTWARQGYLELTEGEVTDYSFILQRIEELAQVYKIREVAFDRFGAASVVTALQELGLEVVQVGQGYVSMSPPS
jgi:phage terminase large subunit-like protein